MNIGRYKIQLGRELVGYRKEVMEPGTSWALIYDWIVYVGPLEIRKFISWRSYV